MSRKKTQNASNGPSQRQLRVGEHIKQALAGVLQRGHFRSEILRNCEGITVSEVRMSPDLKHARAFVMSLGGKDLDEILAELNEEARFLQKEVMHGSNLKFTPRLHFVADHSFDEAEHIETLLKGLHIPQD